jgi:hypothetical protein
MRTRCQNKDSTGRQCAAWAGHRSPVCLFDAKPFTLLQIIWLHRELQSASAERGVKPSLAQAVNRPKSKFEERLDRIIGDILGRRADDAAGDQ